MFDMNGIKLTSNKANVIHVLGTIEKEGETYDYIYKCKAKITQETEVSAEVNDFFNYCLNILMSGTLVIMNEILGSYQIAYIKSIRAELNNESMSGFVFNNVTPTVIGTVPVTVDDEIYITFSFPK